MCCERILLHSTAAYRRAGEVVSPSNNLGGFCHFPVMLLITDRDLFRSMSSPVASLSL